MPPELSRSRFTALWRRAVPGADAPDADAVFNLLADHYGEAHRRYHSPPHILHCLAQHDLAAPHMHDPDTAELALWFHDVIFDVPMDRNEERSAELFRKVADGHAPPAVVEAVESMILHTRHRTPPESHDEAFVGDIDLSSFGMPWKRFRSDGDDVRAELSHITDAEYARGHARFLHILLDRHTIYQTAFFRDLYEAQARTNIARVLRELAEDGLI